jgi:hypothetical protein
MLSQGKGRSKDYISPDHLAAAGYASGGEYLLVTGFVYSSPSIVSLSLPLPLQPSTKFATETDRNLLLCTPGRFYNRPVLSEPKSNVYKAGGT